MSTNAWRITPITGGSRTISHPWFTTAPGCPDARHPTRWCDCKVHPSREAAEQYVAEKEAEA